MTDIDPRPYQISDEPSLKNRRVADIIVDLLVEAGVEVIFGLPGGTIAPIYDALLDCADIRVVTMRHESGAMFAAAAYARATGKLGVALVTSGPGVLNAMTGLASAQCDSIPLLLLGGEVARAIQGRGALQEGSAYALNTVAMASHVTKLSLEIPEATAVPAMFRRAMATAMSGRPGPVFVSLPMNVSCQAIVPPRFAHEVHTHCHIAPNLLQRAANVLQNGGRQLIFAGAGARSGETPKLLLALAEKLQCPVMTTPKGKGVFPEEHPLSLGVYGLGGHPSSAAFVDAGLDVMLAIGTSLGDLQTNGWTEKLTPKHELLQVDVDPLRVGRTYPVTLGFAAPAATFIEGLLPLVDQVNTSKKFGVRHVLDAEDGLSVTEQRISPARALWEIQQIMPKDTIYTIDAGDHFTFATHFLQINHPDAFVCTTGLGSMGTSIGGAIGIKLARPERMVVAICGDGGFAMVGNEMATAVQNHVPILVFVINDGRLGMVENGNTRVYGRTHSLRTSFNVRKLADSAGCKSFDVAAVGDLAKLVFSLRKGREPIVVNVATDHQFTMESSRLSQLRTIAQAKVAPEAGEVFGEQGA